MDTLWLNKAHSLFTVLYISKGLENAWYHISMIYNSCTALKILYAQTNPFFLPPSPWSPGNHDLFNVSMCLLFPEAHTVGVTEHIVSPNWFLSPSNRHLKFLCLFLWLISSYHWKTFTILYKSTTVHLSTHAWKNILMPSKFWHVWIKMV